MPKNVMKLLKPSPNLGKNGFDLSHRKLFDINFGELLPCACIETVPGDDIEIKVADLLRAQPLVTSPFLRAKQHIDFWFVPYNNLWHNFNAFITSRREPNSSTLNQSTYLPHFNLRVLKSQISGASSSVVDIFGSHDDFVTNAYRLLDLLGYPSYDLYYGDPDDPLIIYDDVDVNPFRLLAYQNIWYHEYRQKFYDTGVLGFYDSNESAVAAMFNVDYAPCDSYDRANCLSNTPSGYSNGMAPVWCQMRYRPWKKDLFTGLLPSTQLGSVSMLESTGGVYVDGISSVFAGIEGRQVSNGRLQLRNSGSSSGAIVSASVLGSILDFRSANALQIWRENALRAGNQIEDNYEAHYGVRPKSHLDAHPIAIGSVDAPLNISDIMATATTEAQGANTSVGDIAGKGLSSLGGDKVLRFKTNDFGVIMGIMSILPETEYNSTGVDRNNQLLDRFDFFMPEMENLGLEAVDSGTFTLNSAHRVAGYAPRYYGYKQIPDKVHLKFLNDPNNGIYGVFRPWASPKFDVDSNTSAAGVPLSQLYVRPSTFDVNFTYTYGGSQFLVDLFNDVTAVRPMSVTGMPSK